MVSTDTPRDELRFDIPYDNNGSLSQQACGGMNLNPKELDPIASDCTI